MNLKRLELSGILFIVAGIAWFAAGFYAERRTFGVLGCAFVVIGIAFIARARRGPSA